MCLIVIAHSASERWPFVMAANRDEAYDRPSLPLHAWADDPRVIGGRDQLHGGSWLAVSRTGRVAAVTNLRSQPATGTRSRGLLVRDFVAGSEDPESYCRDAVAMKNVYGGFHLLAGTIGGTFVHAEETVDVLAPGVWGISNGPAAAEWDKVRRATTAMSSALSEATSDDDLVARLMSFLQTHTGAPSLDREIFVASDRYGTRSSTIVVAGPDTIQATEQSYGAAGVENGEPVRLRWMRDA
jgi:uncharacterized protein with NRDE domain